MSLLDVKDLSVDYGKRSPVHAVRQVSFALEDNEFVGLVGESGCGKSTLGFAVARLERPPARLVGGTIRLDGRDWHAAREDDLRSVRWTTLSIVMQSGMNALNPVMSIHAQFKDVMVQHGNWTASEIEKRAQEVLEMVNIPASVLRRYPHELSGGMKQRVAIALALVLRPKLIIMDEPTTALDMVVQRQIMDNLKALRTQQSFSVLFISHDLGLVLELADRVLVMYAGQIVEDQTSAGMLSTPLHPYTRALMKSLPDPSNFRHGLTGIPGSPPNLRTLPVGCAFAPRCPMVQPSCRVVEPQLESLPAGLVRCPIASEEVRVHV